MSLLRHQNNLLKVSHCITLAREGDFTVILCPRELAPRLTQFAQEGLTEDEDAPFLDMGESGDDAILQSPASEETLESLKSDFLQSLSPEVVEAFLERHPQIGAHLASHTLIETAA